MRGAFSVFLAIAIALSPASAAADELEPKVRPWLLDEPGLVEIGPKAWARRPGRFDFLPGERLDFEVRYFGVPIGWVWLRVARFVEWQGVRVAHLVAGARTNAFWSKVYRVDDVSEAWVDLDRAVTLRTRTHTRHGRRHEVFEQVDFDWTTHFVHIREEKRHKDRLREEAFDFGPFVHDTFDLFYALRALPLAPGQAARFPVYANRKVYAFHVDVVRRETIDDPVLGPGEALVLRPYDLLDGEPAGSGAGEVWVRDDRRRLPVRLVGWFRTTSHFRVGQVRADLVAYRERLPGWPEPRTPRPRPTPRIEASEDGRPRWSPPPEVLEARRRAGVMPFERKKRLSAVGAGPPDPGPRGSRMHLPSN